MSVDLSVVIPAKNEEENVKPLVMEIVSALGNSCTYEIVYVDDGSDDGTYAALRALADGDVPQLLPVQHQASVGQSTAILTGVKQATGRLIVTMDADGQNDPADIPAMLAAADKLSNPHFCIAGYRKQRKDTAWKRFQSKIANGIRRRLLKDDTPDTGCGLKVIPRQTYLSLPYFDHMHRFLPALIRRCGGEIVVVEVNHRAREHGVSKYTMWSRLWVGIVDMLGVMWLSRRARLPVIVQTDKQDVPVTASQQ
ncbi:glycosyltransferase family 2 protein [Alteromonas sp. CYL-A6]|uniref:glycosyltransferase family 2 protein n=1 Tax=Alteromonas nitratireducens TaxID=3390813 RepID=UPI0034B9454F